jgi:outer membrane protein OmpA-like peptidoglycan-associated protein
MRYLVLLLALPACSSIPDQGLDQARAAYMAAQNDPQVREHAPAELDVAARALRDAERSRDAAHPAYLAEQRARIARELATARSNEARAQKDRVFALEQRLKQAETQRDQALARAKSADEGRDISDKLAAEVRRLQAQVAELQAAETERGWILTLGGDLLFDPGNASIKPGGRRALANLARVMREHPERKIVVEGFTDDRGSAAANQRLSELRARAVRDTLVKDGIDPERIDARGLGATYPVASNSDRGGRQLNRRVEILIGETKGRAATGGRR